MSRTLRARTRKETGGALRRIWPALTGVAVGVLVAVLILGKLAASAGLVSNAAAFACAMLAVAAGCGLCLVQDILERLGLIDAQKPDAPLRAPSYVAVPRPAPPLCDEAPAMREPVRLTLPGGTAHWGLEGGYAWRPHQDEVG